MRHVTALALGVCLSSAAGSSAGRVALGPPVQPLDVMVKPAGYLEDGSTVPIRIIESANGIAVVDGVEPGTVIRLAVTES